jgi:hypothetical protein
MRRGSTLYVRVSANGAETLCSRQGPPGLGPSAGSLGAGAPKRVARAGALGAIWQTLGQTAALPPTSLFSPV